MQTFELWYNFRHVLLLQGLPISMIEKFLANAVDISKYDSAKFSTLRMQLLELETRSDLYASLLLKGIPILHLVTPKGEVTEIALYENTMALAHSVCWHVSLEAQLLYVSKHI